MKHNKNSSVPQLDLETAGRILNQAFEANHMEGNSIPLDVLLSYSSYRRDRFTWQRALLAFIIVFCLLLPFLFLPVSFTIEEQQTESHYNPVYRLEVDSFLPVERVNAVIDGHSVAVYETDSHVYTIEPSLNGEMSVTVTLINRQQKTQSISVTAVDQEAPAAVSCVRRNGRIYLYLTDEISGVDYSAIRAVDMHGKEVLPDAWDTEEGYVTFTDVSGNLNVYVSDLAGNPLQLMLSVQ